MKLIPKLLAVIAVLFTALAVAGMLTWRMASAPVDSLNSNKQSFVIPKGRSVTWIGNTLEEKGFVRSSLVFRAEVLRMGLGSSLQAGTFELSPGMSPKEIAQALTQGANDVWITILEGWRSEEIAEELKSTLGESFDTQQFLRLAKPLEGTLYPDTYLIPKTITPAQTVQILTRTFAEKTGEEWELLVRDSGKSKDEVIVMASLIQREAKTLTTMRMISGILWKRLREGWPLQVDATLQYIKGYSEKEKTWWPIPLGVDKNLPGPYNTYANMGLPPRPISNPGLNALKAAANPQENQYWFYISDLQGNMHYAITLQEHNQNVDRYLR